MRRIAVPQLAQCLSVIAPYGPLEGFEKARHDIRRLDNYVCVYASSGDGGWSYGGVFLCWSAV